MIKFVRNILWKLLELDYLDKEFIDRYHELKNHNKDLSTRVNVLEKDNMELISFIGSVFPRYHIMNNNIRNNNKLKLSLLRLQDGMGIWELISKNDKEIEEEIKLCIEKNELNIKSISLKASEGLFNKLINEKFPIPEEFKEERTFVEALDMVFDGINRVFGSNSKKNGEPVNPGESENK